MAAITNNLNNYFCTANLMCCNGHRYEPSRDGCDLYEEDLNCPEDWKNVLAKKEEVISSLSLQNELLKRKLTLQEIE